MKPRQIAIMDILNRNEQASLTDLSERFGVSKMTIRRDLTYLQEQGYLIRTHGGGVATGKLRLLQSVLPEQSVSSAKIAIGELASDLIRPGEKVLLDTGTTSLQVALHIPQDSSITVATTSLCIAQALFGSPVTVLVLGGYLGKEFPNTYGPLTEANLNSFHADVLFLGCNGANSKDGFYGDDMHVVSVDQAMIRISERVIVVAESCKFSRKAFVRTATWKDVYALVTDSGLSPEDKECLEEQGVRIYTVQPESPDALAAKKHRLS